MCSLTVQQDPHQYQLQVCIKLIDGQAISFGMHPSLVQAEPYTVAKVEDQEAIQARLIRLENRRNDLLRKASRSWYEASPTNELNNVDRRIQQCLRELDSEVDC